jgi:hypothetical protein
VGSKVQCVIHNKVGSSRVRQPYSLFRVDAISVRGTREASDPILLR